MVDLAPANYIMMAVALVVIAVGFITLARGSITFAPILLVLGYCVLVPLSLLIKFRRPVRQDSTAQAAPAQPGTASGEK